MSEKEKIYELDVEEAIQEDIDKGMARLPNHLFEELKISSGSLIEVKGKSSVILRAMRSLKGAKSTIRLDGTTRSNIGVSIGEKVKISIAKDVKEAKAITLSPLQEMRLSKDSSDYFHNKLLDQPVMMKQKLVIIASSKKLGYVVSKISPAGNVVVTPNTKVTVQRNLFCSSRKSRSLL
jgi:transitional endoplasmic reticulum ATPase